MYTYKYIIPAFVHNRVINAMLLKTRYKKHDIIFLTRVVSSRYSASKVRLAKSAKSDYKS